MRESRVMIYRFKTKDCPDANGRTPVPGESKWTLLFPLEDGSTLLVDVGKEGRAAMCSMLSREEFDDAKDSVEVVDERGG